MTVERLHAVKNNIVTTTAEQFGLLAERVAPNLWNLFHPAEDDGRGPIGVIEYCDDKPCDKWEGIRIHDDMTHDTLPSTMTAYDMIHRLSA